MYVSSLTASWTVAAGATDYVLAASTSAALPPSPVAASSTTLSSTATLAGLAPNTTYFLSVSACSGGCSAFVPLGSTVTFAAPAVGLSTTAVSSSTVGLAWSPNGNPLGSPFVVLRSTDGIAFAAASTVTAPGAALAGLTGGVTYYFEVVALGADGSAAAPSNVLTVVTPSGPTPSAPTGLLGRGGLLSASLTWDPLPPLQQGVGLAAYALLRSTNAAFGYVQVTTTTGLSFVDKPLAASATFYYKLVAKALDGAVSAPSAAVSVSPFNLPPMEPIGVTVAPSSAAVTFAWTPVRRFNDGEAFLSAGTPTVDELGGYSVYRSTDICNPSYTLVSTLPATGAALTDATGGANYYYHLLSFNTAGASNVGPTISSLGERDFFVDDCKSALVLDDASASTLIAAAGGASDVRVVSSRRPQDVGNGVFQSVQWRAYQDGGSELKGYTLPKPARIVLHFDMAAGAPVVDTAPVSGFAPASLAPAGGAVSPSDLGAYWYNGAQWVKMYGKVDAVAQTVTVQSPNLGVYQVRAQARSAGAVFDVSNLASRVITPNGDGRNDTLIFSYDPGPKNVVPVGKVFDLQGAFVADMTSGLVPNTLTWDGRMNGAPVRGGVYVYRITGDGKTFTGSIVVAR
ncbi:MAG: gliding motility-associated C-terminal domain-containing protein [Elusimicrobia bacterium]|nr:gliding motility-associated C-terminal domain-containing protein [Elusimicrobiota bacterium]